MRQRQSALAVYADGLLWHPAWWWSWSWSAFNSKHGSAVSLVCCRRQRRPSARRWSSATSGSATAPSRPGLGVHRRRATVCMGAAAHDVELTLNERRCIGKPSSSVQFAWCYPQTHNYRELFDDRWQTALCTWLLLLLLRQSQLSSADTLSTITSRYLLTLKSLLYDQNNRQQ